MTQQLRVKPRGTVHLAADPALDAFLQEMDRVTRDDLIYTSIPKGALWKGATLPDGARGYETLPVSASAGAVLRSTGSDLAYSVFTVVNAFPVGTIPYATSENVLTAGVLATLIQHTLLSSTHTDALAGTVLRGDVIVANATPKWARVAKGGAATFLRSDGTDVGWSTLTIPNAATAGDLVYASGANALGVVAIGGNGALLHSNGTVPGWATTLVGAYTFSAAQVFSSDVRVAGAFEHDGGTFGTYGIGPVVRPTVTGARAGNAALESLLIALVSQGLVIDSSSA